MGGCPPFWSSSILFVFHFGHLPFCSSSISVVFHVDCLPFGSSSILVVFHFGSLPFGSSSILGGFSSCTLIFLHCGKIHRHTDTHTLLGKELIQPTTETFIMVIHSNSNINILVLSRYIYLVIRFKLSVVEYSPNLY